MTIEELITQIPVNAAYHKIILQTYPDGRDNRWDHYFDDHGNVIREVNTSDITENKSISLEDAIFQSVADHSYFYNADGTIAQKTTHMTGSVRVTRFEYDDDKSVIAEYYTEDGDNHEDIEYENDNMGNPVKLHYTNTGFEEEYEYEYDDLGRMIYKERINLLAPDLAFMTWYEYDQRGNVSLIKESTSIADFPKIKKYFYDDNDRVIKEESYIKDNLSATTVYEYEYYK